MSFIAMLPVSRSPFSAWSERCLTFFSLVRHVSQLGKTLCLTKLRHTHMSHLFQFLTQTLTLHSPQTEHSSLCILHVYPRVSVCFALTLTTFNRSSGTSGKSVVGGSSQPHVWRHPNFVWVQYLSDFPVHFPELGNTHLHCDTAV